jgi:hypothetical protein
MGELTDLITGETLPDTHDERYRQKLARLLLEQKGFAKHKIEARRELLLTAGEASAKIQVDFIVRLDDRAGMIVQYGPGSLVSRERPTLAMSRLVEPYQIEIVVVSNGEDAQILDGRTGEVVAQGLDAIPSRAALEHRLKSRARIPVAPERAQIESRIAFAFEIECSCRPGEKRC